MTSESQECHSPPGAGYRGGRAFRVSTRRRWGCDATLRRAACVGARLFFRERQQRRRQRAPLEHVSREDKNLSCHASIKAQSGHVGEGDERKRSASARPKTTTESVPRSVEDLISRVIHVVKTSCTRLAVYLRGWDSLREYSAGFVEKPPACKPCLSTATKTRGSKEDPPPHRGLFPCLPLPEKGDSLVARYVDFIIATSSFVAVSGNPVLLAAFRRPTSKEHVSLIGHIKKQFHDFLKGAVD